MQEAALTVTTSRGAKVDAIAGFPAGPGPFPAIVLAPGQGYHMARPALAQTAASAGGGARVAIVGGDHGFEDAALSAAAADEARTRNLCTVAGIAASFIAQASRG